MRQPRQLLPPVDYDRQSFIHGDIVITVSTAKVKVPWVTISIGCLGRDPEKPKPWVPFEKLDEIMEALAAFRSSDIAIQSEALVEALHAYRNRRSHDERW